MKELDPKVLVGAAKAGQQIFKDLHLTKYVCVCEENCIFRSVSKTNKSTTLCSDDSCDKCIKVRESLVEILNFVELSLVNKNEQLYRLLHISANLYTDVKLLRNQYVRALLLLRMSEERLSEVIATGRLIGKFVMKGLLNIAINEHKHAYFWKGMRNLSAQFERNANKTAKHLDTMMVSYPKWGQFLGYTVPQNTRKDNVNTSARQSSS